MKKVESNNKGFTLIELLVVIAIMASILVLAITSLNGISKKKKEEAKKKVEDQIILAAKQYFNSNEYLYEWLIDDSASYDSYDTISLKELIYKDYINTLTNPVTSKKYNECNYVKVYKTKKNKFEFKFISDDVNCGQDKQIVLNEEGRLTLNYKAYGMKGRKGWNIDNVTEKATATIEKGGIKEIKLYNDSKCIVENVSDMNISSVEKGKQVIYINATSSKATYNHCAKAITYTGRELTMTVDYNIDKIKPIVTIEDDKGYITSGEPDKWINSATNAEYTLTTLDEHSGIDQETSGIVSENPSFSFDTQQDNKNASKEIKIYDNAGNSSTVTARAKVDITPPVIEVSECNVCVGTNNIRIESVNNLSSVNNVMKLKVTDTTSGVNNIKIDNVNIDPNSSLSDFDITDKSSLNITSSDEAGNSSSTTVNINRISCTPPIQPTHPKLNIKIYKRGKNGKNDGNAIINRTVEGNSNNDPIIMLINNGNWVNMYNYPYGINIEYTPVDEDIKSAKWYENSSQLSVSASTSNTYKWGGETIGYKGTSTATNIIDDGSVSQNSTKSHKLDTDGYREGRIYATNEHDLKTIVLVKIAKDSTGPTLIKGVSPVKRENKKTCKGLSSDTLYPYIYTSFNAIDTLSGINKITHYIDGYDINNNNTTNFYYNKVSTGFMSVENGTAKQKGNVNFDYVMPKNNSAFKPIEKITNGFTIRRNWASVNGNITAARELGCGSVGDQTPELDDPQKNCNYLTISDKAGNKLTARVCAHSPTRKYDDIYTFARTSAEKSIYGIININNCAEHSICN